MDARTARNDSDGTPAIRFDAEAPPAADATLEFVPREALVFAEEERADQYRRVVGLVAGNKLKLLRITVGQTNAIEVVCEAAIADGPVAAPTRFVTRDALILWADRQARGHAKTIVLRVASTLVMLRITTSERAGSIEVLQRIEVGG
jgi:hypothetical protein